MPCLSFEQQMQACMPSLQDVLMQPFSRLLLRDCASLFYE